MCRETTLSFICLVVTTRLFAWVLALTIAAKLCDQPFIVFEGVRTIVPERSLIARGVSALKNPFRCRHVPTKHQKHGIVNHAADLIPIVGGPPQWVSPQIYPIARAR
jgi:peptidoglycan L-alanyl-D-glutamate endopeptidase CwlK